MTLTSEEQAWLQAYRKELERQFPGLVRRIITFGSKARGTATADSDLDILLVIQKGDWRVKDAVAHPGYLLAADSNVVPSILVYTAEEWEQRSREKTPFWQAVNRDGVTLG